MLDTEVPERIADVLQIESYSAIQQPRPHSAPVSKKMPVGPLTGLMAVGTAEGFLRETLRMPRNGR
jgi:hypothetical protein